MKERISLRIILVFLMTTCITFVNAQTIVIDGNGAGKRFDGIGAVNGGGATAVLLKDYPEPQRSQILDMVFKPKFGASVSTMLVEIPGDGNSTQGSMPSHMYTRDDLNYSRGYIWWMLQEAKKRNPNLTLDGTAWSAPGWIGNGNFWSQDAADYYVKWLQGLRKVYHLEFDALGCRNEKGDSYDFAKMLRATLNANGFEKVKIHAFDNWGEGKLNFVKDMMTDEKLRHAIDIISAHTFSEIPASAEDQEMAAKMNKPIWNSEEHIYLKGFDCAISIVKAFNDNYIQSGATKIVNWYDIAGLYPMEPYSEDPSMLVANSPWSGHYRVRQALWGYAHYGQFTQIGWKYLNGACAKLPGDGSYVTLKSPRDDYSIIIETKDAKAPQQISFKVDGGLSTKELCVWRSNAKEQFIQQAGIQPVNGKFTITLEPGSIYSLSTTRGQQKGSFDNVPKAKSFPFPYYENFDEYSSPSTWGYLPHYTADIYGAFEIVERPDKKGKCLQQVAPVRPISWAPGDWYPYTILGNDQWADYEISADVYLNAGDSAGIMGRVNNVGSGYGFVPKGYVLQLGVDGQCKLAVIRGKIDKKKVVGDAEQQALIKAGKDEGEGGEKLLGSTHIANLQPGTWHNLELRFKGSTINGLIDDKIVLTATDSLYPHGMAGLFAAGGEIKLSTPYFDNVLINAPNGALPSPTLFSENVKPLYKKGGE